MVTENADEMRILSEDEAWALLEENSLGRLAFAVAGDPDIVPINYCASGRRLYFRTAGGSKLLGLTINQSVAFEVDTIEDDVARSVVLSGQARKLETSAEIEFADSLPLRPWVPTLKYQYVEIEPDEVNGRQYHLGPEPERD
ncbi:pyridoxamine 5'-phosphate oxidase family protein [Gephyromycinifex aptenodytis]|uniref:pyridoxamine 5'-phosphate oxidase family protein n=1 Tax=Gephyromycinifex aptenodytis TaxID=2716227 RepID=UPI001B2FF9A4|nr:pyridoxamine 5'-phosphate oxidase family protein [Gephyromycinifex aptenodytis]